MKHSGRIVLKVIKSTHAFKNRWGTYSATRFSALDSSGSVNPTIIFVHGFRAKKEWYSWIGEFLANQGYSALLFTVPSADLPDPFQWSDGIKSAIDYLANRESQLHDATRIEKIGVMGHSMGGLGALIAGSEDSRIKCIVGLAPALMPEFITIPKGIYNIPAPVQLQIGECDGLIPPKNVKTFFDSLNSHQKEYLEIEGGNHIRFTDKAAVSMMGEYMSRFGMIGRQFKDRRARITFNEQHSISGKKFAEWFNHYLKH
jgi:dienelactone hydrolase